MKIIRKPTPNFHKGRGGFKVEAIVIHSMEGSLAGTDAWFANRASKVSAHYGIGKNGEVHQYVNDEDTACHAGVVSRPNWPLVKPGVNPNRYTIGIEHEGRNNEPWTEAMYAASAALIRLLAGRFKIPIDDKHIIPHRAIRASKTCPGYGVDMNKLIAMAAQSVSST